MTNNELEIMLRLPNIRRWQIVRTYHTQSVAAHSYRVWLLATHLYDTLYPTPHNSFGRELVQRWAMLHDVDEVLTGDIPSTVKKMLEEVSPGIMDKFTNRLLVGLPLVAATRSGIRSTVEGIVVKVADNVEAILYLLDDGMGDCTAVIESRMDALKGLLAKGRLGFTGVEWGQVEDWIANILHDVGGFTWA